MSLDKYLVSGWLPQPEDPRDYAFSSLRLPRAGAGELQLAERTPISDQDWLPSCVGNAVCDAFEHVADEPRELSRRFVWWNSRNTHGEGGRVMGTYIRNAMQTLTDLGVCSEATCPYSLSVDDAVSRPAPLAYVEAYDTRLSSYYAINKVGEERLDELDAALAADKPVVFGTLVGATFSRTNGVDALSPASDATAGHAMAVWGRRVVDGRREYLIRNSWSRAFGSAGYCWFDESYLTWHQTRDLWVPIAGPVFA